jgi:hypothetical protein
MRILIENVTSKYENDLDLLPVLNEDICINRISKLQKLLFKLAESTISNAVQAIVDDVKNSYLEKIDNCLFNGMSSGEFHIAEFAKGILKYIINYSVLARDALEHLPFSRRIDIEYAQDHIETYTDNIIRKVQLHHCQDMTHLATIMDLGFEDILEIKDGELWGNNTITSSSNDAEYDDVNGSNEDFEDIIDNINNTNMDKDENEDDDTESLNENIEIDLPVKKPKDTPAKKPKDTPAKKPKDTEKGKKRKSDANGSEDNKKKKPSKKDATIEPTKSKRGRIAKKIVDF